MSRQQRIEKTERQLHALENAFIASLREALQADLGLLFGGGLALMSFGILAFVNRLPRIPEDWPG